jgi:hypothetical protein
MLFWLNGQGACDTYDITRLLDERLVIDSARQFVGSYAKDPTSLNAGGDPDQLSRRLSSLADLLQSSVRAGEILDHCSISYHAPADATQTALPRESVDCVFSNTTLEHVPSETIRQLFLHQRQIIKPDGYVMHLIDMSDHFSHQDASISSINFLQYTDEEFARYCTPFLYQNRLRVSWWRSMIEESGFRILAWDVVVNQRALESLGSLKLAPAFVGHSPEELCASSVAVVAEPI